MRLKRCRTTRTQGIGRIMRRERSGHGEARKGPRRERDGWARMGIAATRRDPAEGLIFQGNKSVEPILRTENLWKLYRAGKVEVPALRGVNFEVQTRESVAVMGPSGCGKSSLLYVIGGLAQASRGRVLVDGNDLTALSDGERPKVRSHKIGFVFQRFNLLPTLTAKG